MSNFYAGTFFGSWESDLSKLISVNLGTPKMSDGLIDKMNKKYNEALGYGYKGTTIDPYVSKTCNVSLAVAKEFRLNIESIKAGEIEKQKARIEAEIKKVKDKGKGILKWYHYALAGGGLLALIALSPTLNTLAKTIPSKSA